MTTNGVFPTLFFAMAMVAGGSVATAGSSSTKRTPQAARVAKATHVAKGESLADPFEESSTPTKARARPTPAKPAAAPQAAAAPAFSPAPNLPSKELEAFMKGFEGSWKCDTKFAAGSTGPGSQAVNARTDMTIKKEFGGFSWHGEFRLARTTTTSATSGMFQISYAASTKQATVLSYDSVGSAMIGAGALAGYSVTFTEEGFLKGVKVKVRETLAAMGPRKLYHKVEIEQGNAYQPMAEDTCSR